MTSLTVLRRPERLYDGYVFDLDGTVYLGEHLLPGAAEAVASVRRTGARVVFLTNKPLETNEAYADKLSSLGVPATPSDIVSSVDALVGYLAVSAPRARILPIAEPVVVDALRRAGHRIADPHAEGPADVDMVVVSWDRTFDYQKLVAAFRAVRAGARLVATNPDPFCPTPDGDLPDCAAMLAAIEASTGVSAEATVGKPSVHMATALLERMALTAGDTLLVGDRLLTDVRMAREAGMASALVLTGATRPDALERSPITPEFVVEYLPDILPASHVDRAEATPGGPP